MECLSSERLVNYLGARLPDAERAQVLAHLEGCADCRRRVASPPPPRVSPTMASPGERLDVPATRYGTVGRYTILKELGRGAMGQVLLANDSLLDRPVALKLVANGAAGSTLSQQVANEARAIARLQHPNVVGLFDVVQREADVYLAMEFIDGMTLDVWLREPRTLEEKLAIFLQAAEGLSAAHDAGVVHRDFKPANVLVGRDGRLRVSDFGLATMLGERDSIARGMSAGTPAYMSPEHFGGRTVSAASDQFSFCVALYEAVAGARPFVGDSLESLRAAIERGAPPLPRGVPADIARVVMRGLAVDPKARFGSMTELRDALRRALDAPRRRRARALGTAAITVVVAAGAFVAWPRDLCRLDATRLSSVWNPTLAAEAMSPVVKDALEAVVKDWGTTFVAQCQAAGHHTLTNAEWNRTQGCLEATLDDVDVVRAAAVARRDGSADLLLQYVARPHACVNSANLVRSPLPTDASARKRAVEAYVALAESARLSLAGEKGALARAEEAVAAAHATGHAPTEARALLVRARLEGNELRTTDAAATYEQARVLAQSGGAMRELARGALMQAFSSCASLSPECASQLARVKPLLDALDDPWLTTFRAELATAELPDEPAREKALRDLVRDWNAIPGAGAEAGRAKRSLLYSLIVQRKSEEALSLALELLPEKAPMRTLNDGEALLSRGQALSQLGRTDEALAVYATAEETGHALKLDTFLIDTLSLREAALSAAGRYEDILHALPQESPALFLALRRVWALLELGRWDEAKGELSVLSAPVVRSLLVKGEDLATVFTALITLGIYSSDERLVKQWSSRLETPEANLKSAMLTLEGREADARSTLRLDVGSQASNAGGLLRAELAQREGRWPEALSAMRELKADDLGADQRLEAQARGAAAELMTGAPPAEPCAHLKQALAAWPTHRLMFWPWEAKRHQEILAGHCPGR